MLVWDTNDKFIHKTRRLPDIINFDDQVTLRWFPVVVVCAYVINGIGSDDIKSIGLEFLKFL